MSELPAGWFYPADIDFYRRTFESLPDNSITLEIGCWRGRSICSVADIIKKKNITAYVIDTFKGAESEADGAHKEAQEVDIEAEFRKAISDFDIDKNIKIIKADTRTLKWEDYSVPDKFFDFIFIDGEHTTEAVTNDVKLCLSKLKDDGLLAGHDLLWGTVKVALDKLFKYSAVAGDDNIWQKTIELTMHNKTILFSCWAKPLRSGGWNAKNPSKEYWNKLFKLLKEKGYTIWQIGQGAELKLKTADAHIWDKDLWLLGEDIKNCTAWVGIDNFFHHWALLQFKKPGIVLWAQSDPEIFGHDGNINLLKDKKYLREKQFEMWEQATYNPEAFVEPEIVVNELEKLINRGGDKDGN
jgi:hypothetical protein